MIPWMIHHHFYRLIVILPFLSVQLCSRIALRLVPLVLFFFARVNNNNNNNNNNQQLKNIISYNYTSICTSQISGLK
jgi:hypothetical protein